MSCNLFVKPFCWSSVRPGVTWVVSFKQSCSCSSGSCLTTTRSFQPLVCLQYCLEFCISFNPNSITVNHAGFPSLIHMLVFLLHHDYSIILTIYRDYPVYKSLQKVLWSLNSYIIIIILGVSLANILGTFFEYIRGKILTTFPGCKLSIGCGYIPYKTSSVQSLYIVLSISFWNMSRVLVLKYVLGIIPTICSACSLYSVSCI